MEKLLYFTVIPPKIFVKKVQN